MEKESGRKISQDLLYAGILVAFAGLFVLANYFSGFSLPLYVATMAVAAVLAIFLPRAGFYAIIFLTFIFERFFTLAPIMIGRDEYKIYPIDVILGAVLFGMLVQVAMGKIKLRFKKIDWLLAAFFLFVGMYFLASIFAGGGEFSLAFSTAKNYLFYPLLYFVAYLLIKHVNNLKDLGKVVIAGALGIVWFIVFGLANRHGLWSDFTPLSTEGVRTLAFTHAFYLSMTLIFALAYTALKSDKVSKLLLIVSPIWIVGIVGSMMRHLWISLFVAAVSMMFLLSRNSREMLKNYAGKYLIFAIFASAMLFYGATLFPRSATYEALENSLGIVQNRVVSVANTSGDESILWRSEIWKQATKQYLENPVLGIGFGKLIPVEIGKYHDFVEARNIHNSFLALLVQMGIFGIGLVTTLTAVLAVKVAKKKYSDKDVQIAAYSSLGILELQVVAFMFQPYLEANLLGIFFWINLGILRRLHE